MKTGVFFKQIKLDKIDFHWKV